MDNIKLLRRVQQLSESSLGIVIPSEFLKELDITKGDYMKIHMNSNNHSIVMEKVKIPK